MPYLRHILACNNFNADTFLRFEIAGQTVAWLRPEFALKLAEYSSVFRLDEQCIRFNDALCNIQQRSQAIAMVSQDLLQTGAISRLHGELYPVTTGNRERVFFLLDRALAGYFGILSFGQHLNGYVKRADGIWLWIARRAADRVNYPGKLDNLVAGGVPADLSLSENLAKECHEEAGINASLSQQARPVGTISYARSNTRGVRRDILFCYDLELSEAFQPVCTDGEVQSFELLALSDVADIVRKSDEFKLNCNLVIIDFLIRHGVIQPDDAEYLPLCAGLRQIGYTQFH